MSERSGEETEPVNDSADMANVQAALPFSPPLYLYRTVTPHLQDPVGPNGYNVLKTSEPSSEIRKTSFILIYF